MSFVSIDRKLFNHFLWTENRSFSRFEAWIDLIQLVSYKKNNQRIINGIVVKWSRGQYPISISFLSKRWNWTAQRVRGYICLLKSNKQINTITAGKITILTLCNYEQYNSKQQGDSIDEQQDDHDDRQQGDNKVTTTSIIKKERKLIKQGKSKESDKPTDFLDKIIGEFVKIHGSYEVLNAGKERAAAGKILQHYKKKYPDANSEATLEGLRNYFEQCLNINDEWLKNNMSLPIIVSKFNVINKIITNGKSKGSGATDKELAELLITKFGIKE